MTAISPSVGHMKEPRPLQTKGLRSGRQIPASRFQTECLRDAGQTETTGALLGIAARVWIVLPRPISSARIPQRREASHCTPDRWNGNSSRPRFLSCSLSASRRSLAPSTACWISRAMERTCSARRVSSTGSKPARASASIATGTLPASMICAFLPASYTAPAAFAAERYFFQSSPPRKPPGLSSALAAPWAVISTFKNALRRARP
jgi:hypothetical protein